MPIPPPVPHDSMLGSWNLVEWLLGAGWAAGTTVAGFLWRLSFKVGLLEERIKSKESSVQLRHQENSATILQLQERVMTLDADYKVLIAQIGRLATIDDWRKLLESLEDVKQSLSDRIDRLKD